MEVTVSSNEYKPGALVKLTATLTDRGWPSEGVIHITSTKPDGTTNNFSLYDDGTHSDDVAADGIYTNSFSQTSLEGTYKFFFDATGKNERGELVPRQATRYLGLVAQTVSNGRPCPCEKVCFPCWAHWILLVLILVVIVLIIRCCRRMKAG
jgi:hypothetical protein